ncbi:MAG: hypothetical protein KR126chlam2_00247 [Chlamydiae bacterium]|nr:hypothetical protein [Chlamydiota bacterium]
MREKLLNFAFIVYRVHDNIRFDQHFGKQSRSGGIRLIKSGEYEILPVELKQVYYGRVCCLPREKSSIKSR